MALTDECDSRSGTEELARWGLPEWGLDTGKKRCSSALSVWGMNLGIYDGRFPSPHIYLLSI